VNHGLDSDPVDAPFASVSRPAGYAPGDLGRRARTRRRVLRGLREHLVVFTKHVIQHEHKRDHGVTDLHERSIEYDSIG
jgi:hypothetical protein